MRKWKSRLLPFFTCLVVLCAVLLPQRLSELRDRSLLGAVHAEKLTADNELPVKFLTLAERLHLLYRYDAGQYLLVSIAKVEDRGEAEDLLERIRGELESLAENGVLDWDILPEDLFLSQGNRLYVRDSENLAGAWFLTAECYSKGRELHLKIALDEESGCAVRLELERHALKKRTVSPAEAGAVFLDRLGVENELLSGSFYEAVFVLPENGLRYLALLDDECLTIRPVGYQADVDTYEFTDSVPRAVSGK